MQAQSINGPRLLETAKPSRARRPTIYPPAVQVRKEPRKCAEDATPERCCRKSKKAKMKKLAPMLYASYADEVKNYKVEYRSNASLRDCIRGRDGLLGLAVMSHNAVVM